MELIITIAGIHLVACLSPGPDVFLVVLNSLRYGRKTGVFTSTGILFGVSLQIALGITGISYLLTKGFGMESGVALAGGAWLMYLGQKGLRGARKGSGGNVAVVNGPGDTPPTILQAWTQGLLVNVLNPKAILYFLSLFSVMLGPEVAISTRISSGIAMIVTQGVAFLIVAVLSDQPVFKDRWYNLQRGLDIAISLILFALGLWIWVDTLIPLMA